MFKSQHTLRKVVCALGVSAILAGMPILGHAWEPQKPVEFVVMAGRRGGAGPRGGGAGRSSYKVPPPPSPRRLPCRCFP